MKIILLKDVKKVGRKGDIKDVADGFALNSLIPNNQAIIANATNLKMVETKKKQTVAEKDALVSAFGNAINKLEDKKLVIVGKTNDKGHLFAGVHFDQIKNEFKKISGFELPSDSVLLEKPLKEVGIVNLKVNLHGEMKELTLEIKGE